MSSTYLNNTVLGSRGGGDGQEFRQTVSENDGPSFTGLTHLTQPPAAHSPSLHPPVAEPPARPYLALGPEEPMSYSDFQNFMRILEESTNPANDNVGAVSFCDFFGPTPNLSEKAPVVRMGSSSAKHSFRPIHFNYPHYCDHCNEFIINTVGLNGTKCIDCEFSAHIRCQLLVTCRCEVKGNVPEGSPCKSTMEEWKKSDSSDVGSSGLICATRQKKDFVSEKKLQSEPFYSNGHLFVITSICTPSFCGCCDEFMWAPIKKKMAYHCKRCKINCHSQCVHLIKDCIVGDSQQSDDPGIPRKPSQRTLSTPSMDNFSSGGFEADYDVFDLLGAGQFGVVQACVSRKDGRKWAVKIVNKRRLLMRQKVLDALQQEVAVLKQCTHPGIVSIRDCYETDDQLLIVMELVDGGDLLDYITNKKHGLVFEKEAKLIFYQLLQAVEYLHAHRIVHRDLKPENILLRRSKTSADTEPDPLQPVHTKIADFGFATMTTSLTMTTKVGTPAYLAPEVLLQGQRGYDMGVDMWSLGVILYFMLSGTLPFDHQSVQSMDDNGPLVNFEGQTWSKISEHAKHLVRMLICNNPSRRMNVRQALAHCWLA
eukprot:Ihof_evm8s159 gene=Ihof_evmTU8s159